MTRDVRIAEAVAAVARGWHLVRLRGKRPLAVGWPTEPALTETEAAEWAAHDNLGVNAGRSALLIVDIDAGRGATFTLDALTPRARTGGDGFHVFFRMPVPVLGNSQHRLAPHVDTRGRGGQVVLVGSIHPETGRRYEWLVSPDDCPVAPLPAELEERLRPKAEPVAERNAAAERERVVSTRYVEKAWDAELLQLAYAAPGGRGTQLNRCAFALGRFVVSGQIRESELVAALMSACQNNGLLEKDGEASIRRVIALAIQASRRIAS